MSESPTLAPLFTWRSALASKHGPQATTRLVLLVLGLYMNEKGGSCFPSTRALEQDTGLSRRAVMTHLDLAVEGGWLIRYERQGRGQSWKAYGYRAAIPQAALQSIDAEKRGEPLSPPSPVPVENSATPRLVDKPVEGGEPPSPASKKVVNVTTEGGEPRSPEVFKKSLSIPTARAKADVDKSKARPAFIDAWFERGLTPGLRWWAKSKGWAAMLDLHLEQFRDYMAQERNWKRYTDLDAAFRSCVRDDWGGIRMQAERAARFGGRPSPTAVDSPPAPCRYCRRPSVGSVGGIPYCGHDDHGRRAMDREPAPEQQPA